MLKHTFGLNFFDGVLYINLPMRKDRKELIEKEFKRVSLHPQKTVRIDACLDECNGIRGCVYSHIKALDFALDKKWNNVLILEDDCKFTANKQQIHSYVHDFMHHFKNEWDVFFLGTLVAYARQTNHRNYVQVLFSVRAHAYAVNGPYLHKLKNHFVTIHESLKEDLFFVSSLKKSLDRRWVDLQLVDRWFVGIHQIAQQNASYSDIDKIIKQNR